MLSDERRREIEEEETLRIAEEHYREEVRSRMGGSPASPNVKLPKISFSPRAEPESSGGSNVWMAITVVAIVLGGAYWLVNVSGVKSTRKPRASQAAPAIFRRPVRIPVSQPIASGQVVVRPGGWVQYRIRIVPGMENARVSGKFNANGGGGNDVTAVLTDENEFQNWINGHEAKVYYGTQGRKTTDSFAVQLPIGDFVFAVSNKFSVISQKYVFLDLKLDYERLE